MKNVKKLILNTAALTATSLAMKTVAVLYNVFLTDKIGTAGIGLFTLVMTVYAFIKTLGSSGLSLAGTRLSIDERDGTKHHMRSLVLLGAALGTSVGVLLYFGADLFASLWLSEPDTAGALRILSFSLPFVAMSACLGGYPNRRPHRNGTPARDRSPRGGGYHHRAHLRGTRNHAP